MLPRCSMQTDTTTGYVLDSLVIDNSPLGNRQLHPTGDSEPGSECRSLEHGGTNADFGNQSIWANGQRDTSNSFSFNGVNANNVFNGKSSSQLTSGRVAVNVGQGNNSQTGEIQTSTSVYGAIGQALPTPPPETIEELHVNSAMYDASQGANSGAHIEVITKSGTNTLARRRVGVLPDSRMERGSLVHQERRVCRRRHCTAMCLAG